MKVAHICQSADSRIGGSLAVARDLVAKQVERGIDARLVLLYRSASSTQGAAVAAVPSISLDMDRTERYVKGIPRLRRALREFRPDVIHHHDGVLWTRIVTAGLGVPLVTHGHLEAPATWRGRLIQRFAMAGTQRLLAVSQWTADTWVDAGFPRAKVSVMMNGVDSARFRRRPRQARVARLEALGLDPATRILLWAGRLERHRKGLDRLVQVGKLMPPGWVCVIAGDGTDRGWLAGEIARAQDRPRFLMIGNVSDPEEWFGIADAYLFTSREEPFGLVLLEAAASEAPIIGLACTGGAMDLLRELHADIIDPEDEAKVRQMFNDIGTRGQAVHARRVVEESYSWDSAADRTIEIYRQLTGVQRAPQVPAPT